MALMRYLWVDSPRDGDGNIVGPSATPDYVKAQGEQINGWYFDMWNVTKAQLQETASHGAVGVYIAGNWVEVKGLSGTDLASLVADRVNALDFGGVGKPKVQFDLEMKDAKLIGDCFERWRMLQPTRHTSWTMEGHQGGWIKSVPGFTAKILKAKVRLVPQCYNAPMTVNWDSHEMARDLAAAGFPDALISPFHDAKRLPEWWQGFAFQQGRLP